MTLLRNWKSWVSLLFVALAFFPCAKLQASGSAPNETVRRYERILRALPPEQPPHSHIKQIVLKLVALYPVKTSDYFKMGIQKFSPATASGGLESFARSVFSTLDQLNISESKKSEVKEAISNDISTETIRRYLQVLKGFPDYSVPISRVQRIVLKIVTLDPAKANTYCKTGTTKIMLEGSTEEYEQRLSHFKRLVIRIINRSDLSPAQKVSITKTINKTPALVARSLYYPR